MKSQREIERRYKAIIAKMKGTIDLTNRVNCYRCVECQKIVKTIDIDEGVTPMFIHCNGGQGGCGGQASSSFYKDIAPEIKPTMEWYRPSLESTTKIRNSNPGMLDHILAGGLDLRPIKDEKPTVV